MSDDGHVVSTMQFMQKEISRLHAHSKAGLKTIDWMLRCARRHSPLMGRVMQAHFRDHFSRHRLRIEREETISRKKHQELVDFIRKIVNMSNAVKVQTQGVKHSVDQIIKENDDRHGERLRARDSNALVRLRAENAALAAENMALRGQLIRLRHHA